jgi:hypothetical protein
MFEHKTTEFQLAEDHVKGQTDRFVPRVYVEFSNGDTCTALSIDGAIRLAHSYMVSQNLTAANFGSLGGCFNTSEQEALAEYKRL